jgi:hypothetical protein
MVELEAILEVGGRNSDDFYTEMMVMLMIEASILQTLEDIKSLSCEKERTKNKCQETTKMEGNNQNNLIVVTTLPL